ncbi:hypothetical protein C1645_853316 [Glomus cerebriforme]|uniref:Uncharacterized protein n=1 Tax=Glomus cerebriforme TaxID=658196 RepID=A0A397SQQ5_9GLOM|nr:hypothetical protein C1645_853316 [Glomus cerebriforme]
MYKKSNDNQRSSRLPQFKLKPLTKMNKDKKEHPQTKDVIQKSDPGITEGGKHSNCTRNIMKTSTTSSAIFIVTSAGSKENSKAANEVTSSKNIEQEKKKPIAITIIKENNHSKNRNATGRVLTQSGQVNTSPDIQTIQTKEPNYHKAIGKPLLKMEKTVIPSVPDNPAICKKTTVCYSSIGASFDAKKLPLGSMSKAPSTSTVAKEIINTLSKETSEITRQSFPVNIAPEREIKAPVSRLGRIRKKDRVVSDIEPLKSQKILVPFSSTHKREIDEDNIKVGQTVLMNKVSISLDSNDQIQRLQELRAENIHFQREIEEACVTKAALFTRHTLLQNEKAHLRREKTKTFAQVCQLEHELACENAEIVKLFDEVIERKNNIRFLKQENNYLFCERKNYEEKVAAAKKQLEELVNSLAKIENKSQEVAQCLEQRINVNDTLKAHVNAQTDSHLSTSAPNLASTFRWFCNIL